jgi:hypothetical protein
MSVSAVGYVESAVPERGHARIVQPSWPALGLLFRLPVPVLIAIVIAALVCGWAVPLVGFLGGLLIVDLVAAARAGSAHRRVIG